MGSNFTPDAPPPPASPAAPTSLGLNTTADPTIASQPRRPTIVTAGLPDPVSTPDVRQPVPSAVSLPSPDERDPLEQFTRLDRRENELLEEWAGRLLDARADPADRTDEAHLNVAVKRGLADDHLRGRLRNRAFEALEGQAKKTDMSAAEFLRRHGDISNTLPPNNKGVQLAAAPALPAIASALGLGGITGAGAGAGAVLLWLLTHQGIKDLMSIKPPDKDEEKGRQDQTGDPATPTGPTPPETPQLPDTPPLPKRRRGRRPADQPAEPRRRIGPNNPGGHILHGGPTPKSKGFRAERGEPRSEPRLPNFGPAYEKWLIDGGLQKDTEIRADQGRKLAPSQSYIWNYLDGAPPSDSGNTQRSNGMQGKKKRFYQWDRTHGDIEVIDRHRNHLGSINGIIGEWTSGVNPDFNAGLTPDDKTISGLA